MRSEVQTAQLTVAACVRLQPQNTKDELRGTTQGKTMRHLYGAVMQVWSKLANFPAKFCFRKQLGERTAMEKDHLNVQTKAFSKSNLLFEEQSVFTTSPRTTQLLTFVYLQQLTLYQKALHHALCVVLCIALWALKRFIYIAAELYFWLKKISNCGCFK